MNTLNSKAVFLLYSPFILSNFILCFGNWGGDPEIHIIFAKNFLSGNTLALPPQLPHDSTFKIHLVNQTTHHQTNNFNAYHITRTINNKNGIKPLSFSIRSNKLNCSPNVRMCDAFTSSRPSEEDQYVVFASCVAE